MPRRQNMLVAQENARKICECPPTFKYKYLDLPQIMLKEAKDDAPFNLYSFQGTTDDAIMDAVKFGCTNITALNFASSRNPGGGYINGAIAQEECLCRQYPTLHNSLISVKHNMYPILLDNSEVLFTPGVRRYRDHHLHWIDSQLQVNFVSAAAPNMNRLPDMKFESFEEQIKRTLTTIMIVPVNVKSECIILGAWGCGVFAPKNHIYRRKYIAMMSNVICTYAVKFRHLYKYVYIAVPDDETFQIFDAKVFSIAEQLLDTHVEKQEVHQDQEVQENDPKQEPDEKTDEKPMSKAAKRRARAKKSVFTTVVPKK